MAFIHQHPDWPNFTWSNDALADPLARVRHQQGRLLGKMESLGFELRREATWSVLTSDVITTSAIEGEQLNTDEVRSSIGRRLGLDVAGLPHPSRTVDGVVDMMLDATQNYTQALTAQRLYDWHASLFPAGRSGIHAISVGAWRRGEEPMQVVSGPIGQERVHFEAPAAGRLNVEMAAFLGWFNQPPSIDPVLIAAVAHLWFVTIHPFDDGNGRIARAIADMALTRADETTARFYSMSSQIEAQRQVYYTSLEQAQRGSLDITSWIAWFLSCLEQSFHSADEAVAKVFFKANLWKRLNQHTINERQRLIINRLLDDFKDCLTTSKHAKLAKCSTDTALRDIRELIAIDVLIQNPGRGRSTSYRLAEFDT